MLIFSDFSNSFTDIEKMLYKFNIKYSQVMGHMNTINKMISNFKNDDLDILLLNSEFCASGINLENTTDIVLYHTMNSNRTTQVIGRGQRPGRTCQLNVWKLCYNNEITQ